MSGQLHAPAAAPGERAPRYPLDRRLGGPQIWSGRRGEDYRDLNSDPLVVHSIASRYTDCAVLIFEYIKRNYKNNVWVSPILSKHHAMKTFGRLEVESFYLRTNWTWVTGLIRFSPVDIAYSTHCAGNWVDPRAGLEAGRNLFHL
jgi:hypothetical protein